MAYLTTKELAKILNVHPQTIKRWVKEGNIQPAFRTGKGFRFDLNAVLEALGVSQPPREPRFPGYDPADIEHGTTAQRLLREGAERGLQGDALSGWVGRKLKESEELD